MISPIPWQRLPSKPVLEALPRLRWQPENGALPSAGIAALMLYVALNFVALRGNSADGSQCCVAEATYTELSEMTGLSRSLVSNGLQRLEALDLVKASGSIQKRRYWITGPHERWFKLPCRAIIKQGAIEPFKTFTLRSKHELHAMKLYLYLAACRDNRYQYSMVSYETIYARTGISERDIRRAIALLVNSGLVNNVDREFSRQLKVNEANKYYLKGSNALFNPSAMTGSGTA
jgi:DNA-binding transcriptional ArsR family regulator